MNHYNMITTVGHVGATVAAVVVAFGATIGFHDMTGQWALAALGGVGIASILGLGWLSLITIGSRARRPQGRVLTLVVGVVLVAVALGTSGWALATAIGGKAALASYQMRSLTEHEIALTDAMARVTGQEELVDAVKQHSAATIALAKEEGRSGQGPNFRSYQRTAENLTNASDVMAKTLSEGEGHYLNGLDALEKANKSLGNAETFRLALSDVQSSIVSLNAIDISNDVLSIGMVGLNDRGVPELDTMTSSLRDIAEGSTVDPVTVPRFIGKSRSDATMSEFPVGAWIAAISIDMAPLILLIIVMFAAGEPLLREERRTKRRISDEEIRVNEEEVKGLRVVAE